MPVPRGRKWCGTINQGDQEGASLPHWEELPEGVIYMCWQKEKGDQTERPHLQMYVETKDQKTRRGMVAVFGGGYWAVARGSLEDNQKYCKKEEGRLEGPWERGVPSQQGRPQALDRAVQQVCGGKRKIEDVAAEEPKTFVHFGRGLRDLHHVMQKKLRGPEYVPPQVLVLVGPPGVGKTQVAYQFPSKRGVYMKDPSHGWWNNYEAEDVAVLDDFYGQIKYSEMLRLLDGYPQERECKGGHVALRVTTWIITSNEPPWKWYSFEGEKEALYDRLWRRFDSCVWDMEKKEEITPPGSP